MRSFCLRKVLRFTRSSGKGCSEAGLACMLSQLALARQFIKNAACTMRGYRRRGGAGAWHFPCTSLSLCYKNVGKSFSLFFTVFYVQNDSDQCRNGHNTPHSSHTHTESVRVYVCVCINCCQTVAKAFQDVEFDVVQTLCSVI